MSIKHLLKEVKLPKDKTFVLSDTIENTGIFEVEPFERGVATSVGNLLRRTLLSSIQGYAVTALRVNFGDRFLTSEFESIPGIVEDSLDIIDRIRNLKILIDMESDDSLLKYVSGEFKGTGKCTAKIFENQNVKILNEDALLFETTDESVDIVIELEIELGRGYVPSEITEKRIDEAGTISIDAVFSPIENVTYNIENVRIGHRNDYEKLVLKVTTDGTITPADAIAEAAQLVKENLSIFVNFNEEDIEQVTGDETKITEMKKILGLSIDELELSSRSYNCLRAANIMNIESLVKLTERDIQALPNFGNKSMDEIQAKLAELDFSLGMQLPPEVLN